MDYEKELEKAKLYAEKVKVRQEIEDIKHSNDRRKKLSFSKIAVIFIFSNCVVIELYSMYAMLRIGDLSALGSLVAAVGGQCISLSGYFIKSSKENTEHGIVYETTMKELEYSMNTEEDDGAVG
jgi:hypothetical protein